MKNKITKKNMSHEQMRVDLAKAMTAPRSEAKVPISLKLDADIYMELKTRASRGEANGKYQTLLNQILREHLFEITAPTAGLKELEERVRRLEAKRSKKAV